MTPPVFAVVGRVNKGKSSVIATLAEDERVAISPVPGTTRSCTEYPVRIDGEVQFVLVDTPGFEDAPAVLAWLREGSPPADQRAARVRAFVEHFSGSDEFFEECELLTPILQGACILYVVDGTRPYRDNYNSEMEILRWTGQPSMALINRIGEGDYVDAWRSALDQFFKVVRDFDAHTASFEERVRLLDTFRALDSRGAERLEHAIEVLQQDRARRVTEVARVVTDLLIDALTFTLETKEGEQKDPRKLEDEFHTHLRAREARAYREVERIYHHAKVSWQSADLVRPIFGEDLFAARTWQVLGLSPAQLMALYVVGGALTGSVVDAGVGGTSFLAGTAVGSIVGATAGLWHLQQRFARATSVDGVVGRMRRAFSGEATFRVGPFKHPNFPFVLLDRARLHHEAVQTRAHAKNAVDAAFGAGDDGGTSKWPSSEREAFHTLFKRLQSRPDDVAPAVRSELQTLIYRRLRPRAALPGPSA